MRRPLPSTIRVGRNYFRLLLIVTILGGARGFAEWPHWHAWLGLVIVAGYGVELVATFFRREPRP